MLAQRWKGRGAHTGRAPDESLVRLACAATWTRTQGAEKQACLMQCPERPDPKFTSLPWRPQELGVAFGTSDKREAELLKEEQAKAQTALKARASVRLRPGAGDEHECWGGGKGFSP